MPHWPFVVMELSAYALSIVLFLHARKEGRRWTSFLLWAMAFGLVVELGLVYSSDNYEYGNFLIMLGPEGKKVPLCIGVGWGLMVYAASWTAQRLRQPRLLRPITAGVLAVNIDLSLDPVAEMLGFWHWNRPADTNVFGVPLDNFLGWFFIVSLFSFFVRELFYRIKPGRAWVDWLMPGLGALLAALVFFVVNTGLDKLYELIGSQLPPFLIVFSLATYTLWNAVFHSRRDLPPALSVLAIPLYFHAILLALFLLTGGAQKPEFNTALLLIPQNMLVGFFAFSWVSIARLFPRPSPQN